MTSAPFISYAQNGEDVILHRALKGITEGRYVDVGANDPKKYSVTYAFYEMGWSGIAIEPVHLFAEQFRTERPRDRVIEAAISSDPSGRITLHQIADTGLSTVLDEISDDHRSSGWAVEDVSVPSRRLDDILEEAGWDGEDVHFIVVDTEGAERDVLTTLDLGRWRPWILVVEATRPLTTQPSFAEWEPILLDANYRFSLFDGISRYYVAQEKWDDLHPDLSAPASALDGYISYQDELREREIRRLLQATTDLAADRDRVSAELEKAHSTLRAHDQENAAAILEWRASAVRAWMQAATVGRRIQVEQLHHEMAQHINHIKVVDDEIDSLRGELDALQNTVSWRVTQPLRKVRSLTKRSAP